MASLSNAVVCALIATAFWSLIGYALARRLVPRVLALGAAPVIGWSVHSAVTLPIYLLFGFSPLVVIGVGSGCILVAGLSLVQPSAATETEPAVDHSGMGICCRRHPRPHSRSDAPAKVLRRCGLARRPDLRPCQNRDHRCDDAARSAASQPRFCGSRPTGTLRLLLSLAFQRC